MEILLLKYKPSCYSNSNCHLQSKNGKDLPDETWKQEKSSFKTKWKKKGIKKEWGKRNHIWLKGALLGQNLFPDKASHKNKHPCKISFSYNIRFLSRVKLKFWWCLHTQCCCQRMNEPLFTIFLMQQYSAISLIILFF